MTSNNPMLKKKIEKVARWIIEECNEPISEIEWLLNKIYIEQVEWVKEDDHYRTLKEDIDDNYGYLWTDGEDCVICGLKIDIITSGDFEWQDGHNAEPIKEGRCCTECNNSVVIPTRLREHFKTIHKENK